MRTADEAGWILIELRGVSLSPSEGMIVFRWPVLVKKKLLGCGIA